MTVFSPRSLGALRLRALAATPPLFAILCIALGVSRGEAAQYAPADFAPAKATSAIAPTGYVTAHQMPDRSVRVAQSNNPLAAFFSIFQGKPKNKPVVVRPQRQRGPVIQQLPGGGRRIFNPFFANGQRPQSKLPDARPRHMGRRTMCVRMCDGYYWPMRRGGSNASLMTDSQKCESQCSSPAKLFILRSSTDNIADMRSLDGQRYRQLDNAFAYRKTFNPSCGCRAKPWSERAQLRHRQYAAVGRERARIALKKVQLDLRSTLKPARLSLTALEAEPVSDGIKRFWDPALPVRNPSVRTSQRLSEPGPVARSRTAVAQKPGDQKLSGIDAASASSLAARKVSALKNWLRADVFAGEATSKPAKPDVMSGLKLRSTVH
ncbi:MAG: DUF2865 domain-containing protein [Pseudomonadota bacterium]